MKDVMYEGNSVNAFSNEVFGAALNRFRERTACEIADYDVYETCRAMERARYVDYDMLDLVYLTATQLGREDPDPDETDDRAAYIAHLAHLLIESLGFREDEDSSYDYSIVESCNADRVYDIYHACDDIAEWGITSQQARLLRDLMRECLDYLEA